MIETKQNAVWLTDCTMNNRITRMPQQTPISRYLLAAIAACMLLSALPQAENIVREWKFRRASVQLPKPERMTIRWI